MSNQDRLKLCRRYFFIGFFGLPFLWMINTVWFGMFIYKYDSYQEQRRQQQQQRSNRTNRQPNNPQQQTSTQEPMITNSPEQSNDRFERNPETIKHLGQIRTLVIYSFCGSMIWIVTILAWVITFQLKRADWGEWGDEISFNIPRGIP